MKIQKKKYFFFFGGGGGRGGGRSGWGGVRVDVNKELKGGVRGEGRWRRESGGGGGCRVGGGGGGVRVDVNAMLGVGGDVGYGGCEPRIEGIVQCTMYKKVLYNIKKMKKCGGGRGRGNI